MTGPPVVEMLWEGVEPGAAVRARFGFNGGADVAAWLAAALDAHWGLALDRCDRVVISAWNGLAWVGAGDRRWVAKWSAVPSTFGRLDDVARLLVWLDREGVAVAPPFPALKGSLRVRLPNRAAGRLRRLAPLPGAGFSLCLTPEIPGQLLDPAVPTQVAAAGQTLAMLHAALARYPGTVGPHGAGQLVHHDYRAANILHDGVRITAVLDFDEVRYASPLDDLARAAVYLGTRYHDWGPVPAPVRQAFVAAYSEHTPLARDERAEVDRRIGIGLAERGWA